MARSPAPNRARNRDRPRLTSCCGLIVAKAVLCAMNVASFAIAAGLVAVGTKKARAAPEAGVLRAGRGGGGSCGALRAAQTRDRAD
jgi:hypothetical protein